VPNFGAATLKPVTQLTGPRHFATALLVTVLGVRDTGQTHGDKIPRPSGRTTLFSPEAPCFPASNLRLSTHSYQLSTSRLRRLQPNEMLSIFARLGLGGDFWDPRSDTFG
jgi:hypothetical protein